jgi:hypothetical protein
LITISPLNNVKIYIILAPSSKSVFGILPTKAQENSIKNLVCVFPFIVLNGNCQCPKNFQFVLGKCVEA